jgi:CheY-like chemotaxis protein
MKSLRALILDPDRAACRQVAKLLGKYGFDSVAASDGGSALRFASSNGIDLIVADFHLPNLVGPRLVDYVRSGAFGLIPPPLIILSTSRPDETGWIGNPAPNGIAVLERPFTTIAFAAALNAAFPVD